MTVYISNLVAGLDKGLDHTELLLEMTRPFGGRVGIEFFIHTYSEAYMERMGAAGRKYMQERYRADRIGRRLWELCERIEL